MHILNQMASQYQTAIIVVTHDEKIIPTFKRIYHIRDGRTFEEEGEGRALEQQHSNSASLGLGGITARHHPWICHSVTSI